MAKPDIASMMVIDECMSSLLPSSSLRMSRGEGRRYVGMAKYVVASCQNSRSPQIKLSWKKTFFMVCAALTTGTQSLFKDFPTLNSRLRALWRRFSLPEWRCQGAYLKVSDSRIVFRAAVMMAPFRDIRITPRKKTQTVENNGVMAPLYVSIATATDANATTDSTATSMPSR